MRVLYDLEFLNIPTFQILKSAEVRRDGWIEYAMGCIFELLHFENTEAVYGENRVI